MNVKYRHIELIDPDFKQMRAAIDRAEKEMEEDGRERHDSMFMFWQEPFSQRLHIRLMWFEHMEEPDD